MKKIVSILLIFVMLFAFFANAQGQGEADTKKSTQAESTKKSDDGTSEKKSTASGDGENSESTEGVKLKKLNAQSPYAILLDMKTGNVLYKKSAAKRVYPASLTKIMTAVIVLENSNMEELVTARESALANVSAGNSKVGLIKDEKLSVRQLLYAMLLSSAADAANVLAEHIDGSIEKFSAHMNECAAQLGMKNTNFTNPVGDHDERHYTTAQDMAKLVLHAMKNEDFREIVKTNSYSIPATEKCSTERKIANKNYFVSPYVKRDYYYKYATGIKTGYTKEAKSCIAASAEKDNMQLVCIVFGAKTVDGETQSFTDCQKMFDFVFENYTTQPIVKAGQIVTQTTVKNTRRTKKMVLKTESAITALKNKKDDNTEITFKDTVKKGVKAPVSEGTEIGTREYFLNGTSVGTVKLVADKDYKFDLITFLINKTVEFFTSPWMFAVIFAVIVVLIMAERRRRRILRKRRRDARKRRNREIENMVKSIHR